MTSQKNWDFYYRTIKRLAPDAEHEQYSYFRVVREVFQPRMRWLDAGCGHRLVPEWMKGAADLELKFLGEAGQIVGCDIDPAALGVPSSIPRVASRLEALPFEEGVFDLVTCNMVVEHLNEPRPVFSEMYRALKPNGVVVIHTPNLYHWTNLIAWLTPHSFHQWVMSRFFESNAVDVFPTRYHCNSAKALRRMLAVVGFEDVQIHSFAGRPRLVGFGPVLYVECLFFRLIQRFPSLHETLCVQARKPGTAQSQRAAVVGKTISVSV